MPARARHCLPLARIPPNYRPSCHEDYSRKAAKFTSPSDELPRGDVQLSCCQFEQAFEDPATPPAAAWP